MIHSLDEMDFEEPDRYSPWGYKEFGTTERLNTNVATVFSFTEQMWPLSHFGPRLESERGALIRCLPVHLSCPRRGPCCSLLSRPPLHTRVTLLPLGREQALTGPQLSAVYRAGLGREDGDRMQGAQEAGDKEEGQETWAFFQNPNNLTGKKECDWHCSDVTRTSSITGSQSVNN